MVRAINDVLLEVMCNLEKSYLTKFPSDALETKIKIFDDNVKGIEKSELVVFAGEKGAFRQKFFTTMAVNLALYKKVLFIEPNSLKTNFVFETYTNALNSKTSAPFSTLKKINFVYNDKIGSSFEKLIEYITTNSDDDTVVFIDSYQAFSKNIRDEYFYENERKIVTLKNLARKLNIPIVLSVHFSYRNARIGYRNNLIPIQYDSLFENSDKLILLKECAVLDYPNLCAIKVLKNRKYKLFETYIVYDKSTGDFVRIPRNEILNYSSEF